MVKACLRPRDRDTARRCPSRRACFPGAQDPCGTLWKVPFREAALDVAKDQGTESCRTQKSAHRWRPATWNRAAQTATTSGVARCPKPLHSRALEDTSPRQQHRPGAWSRSRRPIGIAGAWSRGYRRADRLSRLPPCSSARRCERPLAPHTAHRHGLLARATPRTCPLFGLTPRRAAPWKGGCEVQWPYRD